MKRILVALFAGTLFGAGLAYSDMVDPARVRAFLDIFGDWDPTLAFVMGGALLPMSVAWMGQRRMDAPFADAHFNLPDTQKIDGKLVIGAVMFGVGWGLSGLCPGPALADLSIAPLSAVTFGIAMLGGMIAQQLVVR